MKRQEVTSFDITYAKSLREVMNSAPTKNQRTGKMVRAMNGLVIVTGNNYFPLVSLRDIKPMWACAEAVWFMGGRNDLAFMKKFGFKAWDPFALPDGNIPSATGWRWRHAFQVDQLKCLIQKLRADNTNRQGVLISWDPVNDNLNPGANVPCLVMWHFHILDGRLHMTVLQRSADMYFGFPHDILGSAIVQGLLAVAIGVKPGMIMYTISNAHLYEDQWTAAEEMIFRAGDSREIDCNEFPKFTQDDFLRAMIGDESLPLELHTKVAHGYKPWPAIHGPKLAL